VPPDAITTSGSGLDPYISPQNADLQVNRVAAARHLPVSQVKALVDSHVQGRTIGFLGAPRVNVLALNIALDQLSAKPGS
jgi:K+-transporting ATPase ATPase C chain